MGVQSDLVIVDLADAKPAVAESESPALQWQGFSFTGLDNIKLCSLLSLLVTDDIYQAPYIQQIQSPPFPFDLPPNRAFHLRPFGVDLRTNLFRLRSPSHPSFPSALQMSKLLFS